MARVTVKETTELALELGYTLKKVALGYTLIDSESKPQYSFRHIADMSDKLMSIKAERFINALDECMEVNNQLIELLEVKKQEALAREERELIQYLADVQSANELIEPEGMSKTYQNALYKVEERAAIQSEHLATEEDTLFFQHEGYIQNMDNLYSDQQQSITDTSIYVEVMDIDMGVLHQAWIPSKTSKESSIYEDLTGEFYWDNVNNTLTDKRRTCETCKHVDWEDGCNVSSSHPNCKEIYVDIHAYEDLHGDVDFKVAQTCKGYEYHNHSDGEQYINDFIAEDDTCVECGGDGEVEISKPYFDDGRWLPGYQNVKCNVCEGTGKA